MLLLLLICLARAFRAIPKGAEYIQWLKDAHEPFVRRSGIVSAMISFLHFVLLCPGLFLHMMLMKLFIQKLKLRRIPIWQAYAHDHLFWYTRYGLAAVFERAGYSGYISHRDEEAIEDAKGGNGFFDVGLGWS